MHHALHRILVVALIITLIATPVTAETVDPRFEAFSGDPTLERGQEAVLTIQLLNDAADPEDTAETAKNAEVTLSAGDSQISVQSGTKFVGDLADGSPTQLSFRVTVPPDAATGDHDLELTIRYELDDEHHTETISVPITVEPAASFEGGDAVGDVQVGETSPLSVTLENVGDAAAYEASVTLESPSSELTFAGGATRTEVFVGRWEAGTSHTVRSDLTVADSARVREFSLKATVRYEDRSGRQHSATVPVAVEPAPRQSFKVVGIDNAAPIGGSGTLTISVRNEGPDAAYESTLTVDSTDADVTFAGGSPSAQSFTGDWAVGEVRNVSYRLRVTDGAIVRDYPLRLTVRYEDEAGHERAPRQSVVAVRPLPEQTFGLRDVASTLAVGDEGTVEGAVENTGETAVRNAVVVLSPDNANIVPVETEFAVGDLRPGETATFEFDASVTDSADAGPRQVSFVVRYRDADDDVRRSDPLDARIQIGARTDRFGIEPLSATFEPGDSGVLELRVTNDGEEAVSDVSAKLFADDPLSSGDDEAFIDKLGPGESTTIRFSLSVAADAVESKVYPVSMDFQYEDVEGDTRLSDSYRIPVSVTASEDGGGLPLALVGGGALVILLIVGGVLYLRRR